MDRNTKRPNLSTGSPTVYKLNFVEIPKRNVSCVTETSEKNRIKLILRWATKDIEYTKINPWSRFSSILLRQPRSDEIKI